MGIATTTCSSALQGQLARHYRTEEIAGFNSRASAPGMAPTPLIVLILHHAMAAGDMQGAAQLVETHRHATMNHSQFQRLEQLQPPASSTDF